MKVISGRVELRDDQERNHMRRLAANLAIIALTAAALTSCGGQDSEGDSGGAPDIASGYGATGGDYCDLLAEAEYDPMSRPNASLVDLAETADAYEDVSEVAPSDVRDSWEAAVTAIREMVDAFESAGVVEDQPLGEVDLTEVDSEAVKAMGSTMKTMASHHRTVRTSLKTECGTEFEGS